MKGVQVPKFAQVCQYAEQFTIPSVFVILSRTGRQSLPGVNLSCILGVYQLILPLHLFKPSDHPQDCYIESDAAMAILDVRAAHTSGRMKASLC